MRGIDLRLCQFVKKLTPNWSSDMENQWERVEEDSPFRCQAVIPTKGQCLNRQMDGSKFCPAHGGNRACATTKEEQQRLYLAGRFQNRMNQLEDHSQLKSLRSEIAILRMILETRLQRCEDDHDLILHSVPLADLVLKIEKLVSSCSRLDLQLSKMLDTTQAINWANEIVSIIGEYVTDSNILSEIADRILEAYQKASGEKNARPAEQT